jgi:hypothetical protein
MDAPCIPSVNAASQRPPAQPPLCQQTQAGQGGVGTMSIWQDSQGALLVTAQTRCGWLLHQPPGAPPANAVDVAHPSSAPLLSTAATTTTTAATASKAERRAAYSRPLLLLARLRGGSTAAAGDDSSGCADPSQQLRFFSDAQGTSSCLSFVVPAASVRQALRGGDQLAVLARFTVSQFTNDTCDPIGAAILRSAGPAGPGVQQACGGAVAVPYSAACSAAAATAAILSAASLEGATAPQRLLSVVPAAVQRLQVPPSASARALGGGYGSYGGRRALRAWGTTACCLLSHAAADHGGGAPEPKALIDTPSGLPTCCRRLRLLHRP